MSDDTLNGYALSDDIATDAIVVSLALEDSALNERVAAAFASVPEFRLAKAGERADVIVVNSGQPKQKTDGSQSLTERELEVLTLLAEGASNKVIARRLSISVHTAKFHVSQLIDKLDAIGRTDAVAHAARLGVLNL